MNGPADRLVPGCEGLSRLVRRDAVPLERLTVTLVEAGDPGVNDYAVSRVNVIAQSELLAATGPAAELRSLPDPSR